MYEMKPEYYIGIDMIDEEHKQLDQQSRGMCRHSSELPATGLPRGFPFPLRVQNCRLMILYE